MRRLGTALAGLAIVVMSAGTAQAAAPVSEDFTVVTSADGATLEARYYRPATGTDLPVVLLPHGGGGTVESEAARAQRYAENGFLAVVWSARGHGNSEGLYDLFGPKTISDTKDVLDWVLAHRGQTRAGDRIGSVGYSQGGGTTNMAAAFDPRIDAIAPGQTFSGLYESLFVNGCLKTTTDATIMLLAYYAQRARLDPTISGSWSAYALTGQPESAREQMEVRSPRNYVDRIGEPSLWVQAFDDPLFPGDHAVRMDRLMDHPENRLWLSWGGHFATTDVSDEIGPRENALLGWMQHWLTGAGAGEPALPRVTWWSMNEQRDGLTRHGSPRWPPPEMRYRDLKLAPGQAVNAGTQPGDDPIGNWGANQAGLGEVYRNLPSGTPADTLITATEPLDQPVIYAGAAQADLRWTSTAADSQANVKVWDVAPDGTGTLLARGCTMAPGEPGAQRRVRFELWPSAVEIPAGHHLEVWVQPADVPTFRPAAQQAAVELGARSVVRLPLIGAAQVRPADAARGGDDPSPPTSGQLDDEDSTGPTLPATGGQAGAVWLLMAGAAAIAARRR